MNHWAQKEKKRGGREEEVSKEEKLKLEVVSERVEVVLPIAQGLFLVLLRGQETWLGVQSVWGVEVSPSWEVMRDFRERFTNSDGYHMYIQ